MKNKKKILYLDDNLLNLRLFEFQFKDIFDLEITTEIDEAYSLLKENNYDLVILDFCMPNTNGYEFADLVKKEIPKYNKIPFMILSAYFQEMKENPIIDHFVKKPWEKDHLKKVIDNI